jgi:biotin carboxyl carrier protein
MKLKAQLAEYEYEVSLKPGDGGTVVAEVDGRHYELQVTELSGGLFLLLNGTNIHRCRVEPADDNSFEVTLGGKSHAVSIIDPKRLRSGQAAGAHDGVAEIVSPMPGKVVRVLVEKGAHVEAGTGIVVVEAMKMQNEMKSPKAGVVVSIKAEAGATVNAGDVLAVIE